MRNVKSESELTSILHDEGKVLFAPAPEPDAVDRSILAGSADQPDAHILYWCIPKVGPTWGTDDGSGLTGTLSDLMVSEEFYRELCEKIKSETSPVRRYSSRPITRAFTYVDISDFSKLPYGIQLLVVLALVRIAEGVAKKVGGLEAQLCIGDGYIYVWDGAVGATRFAANLAQEIERSVASEAVPEFHFRIGVHVGEVRWFWDPGRETWNYVGAGINGGNRVLSAIGKETDDVVFVSGEVRTAIQKAEAGSSLLASMHNRGRRPDKHGKLWRVYEVHHPSDPMGY